MKLVAVILLIGMLIEAGFELYFHGKTNIPNGSVYWIITVLGHLLKGGLVALVLMHKDYES